MTPQSGLSALFGGGGQPQQSSPDQSGGGLAQQLQSIQVTAVMIARNNPALAPAMRQIIQIAHAASNQAAQAQGGGGGQPAGPPPAQ
jgi:hypothetical protein